MRRAWKDFFLWAAILRLPVTGGGGPPPTAPDIILQDSFTDTESKARASHVPEVKPAGAAWASRVGTWVIQSNTAGVSAGIANGHATINSGLATGIFVQCEAATTGTG